MQLKNYAFDKGTTFIFSLLKKESSLKLIPDNELMEGASIIQDVIFSMRDKVYHDAVFAGIEDVDYDKMVCDICFACDLIFRGMVSKAKDNSKI